MACPLVAEGRRTAAAVEGVRRPFRIERRVVEVDDVGWTPTVGDSTSRAMARRPGRRARRRVARVRRCTECGRKRCFRCGKAMWCTTRPRPPPGSSGWRRQAVVGEEEEEGHRSEARRPGHHRIPDTHPLYRWGHPKIRPEVGPTSVAPPTGRTTKAVLAPWNREVVVVVWTTTRPVGNVENPAAAPRPPPRRQRSTSRCRRRLVSTPPPDLGHKAEASPSPTPLVKGRGRRRRAVEWMGEEEAPHRKHFSGPSRIERRRSGKRFRCYLETLKKRWNCCCCGLVGQRGFPVPLVGWSRWQGPAVGCPFPFVNPSAWEAVVEEEEEGHYLGGIPSVVRAPLQGCWGGRPPSRPPVRKGECPRRFAFRERRVWKAVVVVVVEDGSDERKKNEWGWGARRPLPRAGVANGVAGEPHEGNDPTRIEADVR